MLNCSNEYPLTENLYRDLKQNSYPEIIVFTCLAGVFCITMLIMYIESVYFIFKFYGNHRQKIRIMFLLALCPVVGWTSLLVILVPRCTLISQFVASIYLSFCIVIFLNLLIDYFGGSAKLLEEMSGQHLNFATPPCCCCCLCCRKLPFNKKYLRIASVFALQVAIVRPIVLFLATALWTDEKYIPGQEGEQASVNFVISIFSSVSTLLGIWGLGIVYRSTRHKLPMFRIGLKFASFQLVLVFVNLQSFVISILAANGIPPCDGSRGPLLRGSRMNHYLLILEMFLISIVSRFAFRRLEAHNIHQYPMADIENKGSSDNEVGNGNFVDVATAS